MAVANWPHAVHGPRWQLKFVFCTASLLSLFQLYMIGCKKMSTLLSFLELLICYLPWISVILTVLMETKLWISSDDTEFNIFCLRINAGWLGGGRNTSSLLSIEITVAIVGLSTASSCTHRNPMCMHLKISLW